jgi:hypothetical protein
MLNSSRAQKLRRLSNSTILGYYFGIADNYHQKKSGMLILKTSFNYKLSPNYGLGIGVGQGNYAAGNYNLFTTFLDSRYFFKNKLQGLEIYFNPGYAVKIDPAWREGLMLGLGASYPFSRRKHSNWNVSLSYRYQEVLPYNPEFDSAKLHGLGLGVGLSFN